MSDFYGLPYKGLAATCMQELRKTELKKNYFAIKTALSFGASTVLITNSYDPKMTRAKIKLPAISFLMNGKALI